MSSARYSMGPVAQSALSRRARLSAVRLLAVALVVCVVSGCMGPRAPSPQPKLAADYEGSGPGTLLAAYVLQQVDPKLSSATSLAARIEYTSTSGVDDTHPTVDAAVFVPRGDPPPGGWPIVAFGHPITGIDVACAPTRSTTFAGSSPSIGTLLAQGYVVVAPDYQGLGLAGTYHPFLDSTTVGLNLVDAVFAARRLVPTTALTWLAVGATQGGQAAWAADELADNAGVGLHLVGAVSLSPLADMADLAEVARTGDLTVVQRVVLRDYLATLKKEYPDFDLDRYRTGLAKERWDSMSECTDTGSAEREESAQQITPEQLRPDSQVAADVLRGYLDKTTLPQGPTAAPLLVSYGEGDALVPAAWTQRAIGRACEMGDHVQIESSGQSSPLTIESATTLSWMRERFDGLTSRNDCVELLRRMAVRTPPSAVSADGLSTPPAVDGGR